MVAYGMAEIDNFIQWVQEELKERNWSRAELARRADLHESTVSQIMNQKRGLGEHTIAGFAKTQ